MRFLVDAQLPAALARWLETQGHDAVHVYDIGLLEAEDKTIWRAAIERDFVNGIPLAVVACKKDGPTCANPMEEASVSHCWVAGSAGGFAVLAARLKRVTEFTSRELTDSTEIGPTWLGHLLVGLQQLLAEVEPQAVIQQFQQDLSDFMEVRPLLIDMLRFMEREAPEEQVREAAKVLGARLKNLRALGQ